MELADSCKLERMGDRIERRFHAPAGSSGPSRGAGSSRSLGPCGLAALLRVFALWIAVLTSLSRALISGPAWIAAAGLLGTGSLNPATSLNSLTTVEAQEGFELLFNGQDLQGWDGDPELWSVHAGSIVGSSDLRPLRRNSFLVSDREFADFKLRFEVRLRNGNSGMQFRSEPIDRWTVRGYQLDFASGKGWGNLHGEGLPGGLILDGWEGKAEFVVRQGWNRVEIHCRQHRIRIAVNGLVVNDVLDPGALAGVLAMQLHRGEAMRVEFRNIRILQLPAD